MKMMVVSRTISHMMIKSWFEILFVGIYSAHHDDDDCDDGDGGSDGEVWVEAKMLSFSWSDNRIECWKNKRAGVEN